MAEQIPGWLKTVYALSCLGVLILILIGWLAGRSARRFNKAWAPLLRVAPGTVKNQRTASTLSGSYHGHPVQSTISIGGKGIPDTFSVQMPAGPGGRDWEIAHRSDRPLGKDTWRAFTKDPALHARFESARIPERLNGWPESTTIRYDAGRGTLSLGEQIFAPPAEHFRAQLDALEAMLEVNRELNAG